MSEHTSSNGHGSTAQRLAVAQHERRQAIYDASGTPSELPPAPLVIPPRDKLPTLDDLTGPEAPKARWKLVAAGVAGLVSLAEAVRQIVELVRH